MSDSFGIPWTVAYQAPLSMGFPRQEYRSGLSFPSPGISPTQGSSLRLFRLLHRQADSLPLSHLGSPLPIFTATSGTNLCWRRGSFHLYYLPFWTLLLHFIVVNPLKIISCYWLLLSEMTYHWSVMIWG